MNDEIRRAELENLVSSYKKLNTSFKRKLIYRFGTGSGFFSEFNGMLLAVLYALVEGYRFELYSEGADFCLGGNLNTVFKPFCPVYKNKIVGSCVLRDRRFNTPRNKVTSLYKLFNKNITEDDVFWFTHTNRFAMVDYSIPELGINGTFRDAMRKVIPIVWRLTDGFREEADKLKEKIDLPEHFVGMHIRGGDKETETDLISPQEYVEAAEKRSPLRSAFVFTDEYSYLDGLKKQNPAWTFQTLATKDDAGYQNEAFLHSDREKQHRGIVKMLASVELLLQSDLFVGTFSSNPAMFVGMILDDSQMIGLDYSKWLLM